MLIVVVEGANPKVRGYLSSWCLQVASGVYVANLPASTRETLWRQLTEWAPAGMTAVLVWGRSDTEQGLQFLQLGMPRRRVEEREGLVVSRWLDVSEESR